VPLPAPAAPKVGAVPPRRRGRTDLTLTTSAVLAITATTTVVPVVIPVRHLNEMPGRNVRALVCVRRSCATRRSCGSCFLLAARPRRSARRRPESHPLAQCRQRTAVALPVPQPPGSTLAPSQSRRGASAPARRGRFRSNGRRSRKSRCASVAPTGVVAAHSTHRRRPARWPCRTVSRGRPARRADRRRRRHAVTPDIAAAAGPKVDAALDAVTGVGADDLRLSERGDDDVVVPSTLVTTTVAFVVAVRRVAGKLAAPARTGSSAGSVEPTCCYCLQGSDGLVS
jgi:hypothetical protein